MDVRQAGVGEFSMGGPRNRYRSLAWTSMNTIFAQAQRGMLDLDVLGATQIDRFGNLNLTMLEPDYHRPGKRFPGSGGANEVLSQCWQTVIVIKHERRRFVEKVDFVTSPGVSGWNARGPRASRLAQRHRTLVRGDLQGPIRMDSMTGPGR